MEKESRQPRGCYVEKGSFFAHAAVVIFAVSAAARLLGTLQLWGDLFRVSTQIVLPIACALVYVLFLLLLGRIALWTTILPVLGGAAFFILSVTGQSFGVQMVVCIVLAFLAAFVYTATLVGMIRTKWLNVFVFTAILAYQIVFLAIPLFSNVDEPVSFAAGMTLISSICMVLAMLLASLAIRRAKVPEETEELPKIKDPKVILPAAPAAEQPAAQQPSAPASAAEPPAELVPETEETAVSAAPEETAQEQQ